MHSKFQVVVTPTMFSGLNSIFVLCCVVGRALAIYYIGGMCVMKKSTSTLLLSSHSSIWGMSPATAQRRDSLLTHRALVGYSSLVKRSSGITRSITKIASYKTVEYTDAVQRGQWCCTWCSFLELIISYFLMHSPYLCLIKLDILHSARQLTSSGPGTSVPT